MTKATKGKIFKALWAGALCVVMAFVGGIGGYYIARGGNEASTVPGGDSFVVSGGSNGGISLMSKTVSPEEYSANGVPEGAESAQTITATITPENASNQNVVWKISWNNESSTWATGKTVTDYVNIVNLDATKAKEVVVYCMKPFGEQVVITAKPEGDQSYSASCTCDYVKRLLGIRAFLTTETPTYKQYSNASGADNYIMGDVFFINGLRSFIAVPGGDPFFQPWSNKTANTFTVGDNVKHYVDVATYFTEGTLSGELSYELSISPNFTSDVVGLEAPDGSLIAQEYLTLLEKGSFGKKALQKGSDGYYSLESTADSWKQFSTNNAANITKNEFISLMKGLREYGSSFNYVAFSFESLQYSYSGTSYINLSKDFQGWFDVNVESMSVDIEGIDLSDSSLTF